MSFLRHPGRRQLLAFAAPLVAAACGSSSEPVLYTIAAKPGRELPTGPRIVQLREIGLARYLDRREIVRSTDGYRLDVTVNEWWGEPLGTMLTRVLVVGLSQRLPGSNIYGEGGAISVDPNAVLAINIQRLDLDQNGTIELLAQAAVEFNRPRRTAARTFRITRPAPTANVAGQVVAISDAVAELNDGLAVLLQP